MDIPPFDQPCFYLDELDSRQRRFFSGLEEQLTRGEYPEVGGNVAYLFLHVNGLLNSVETHGFESLHGYLIQLAEAYSPQRSFASHCRLWAYDCLLGQKKYEQYLEKTEPESPLGQSTHPSNLRLNVQEWCGVPANATDILRMFNRRTSKVVSEHVGLYRDLVDEVFAEEAESKGGWFPRLTAAAAEPSKRYPHGLFAGATIPRIVPMEFGLHCFYVSSLEPRIVELAKTAENKLRSLVGVPQIGEGWVSETLLFRSLTNHFCRTVTVQHGQPLWLGRQHFDVWFPDWNIAVEYHGEQHFRPVEFFGGTAAFEATVKRDARKAALAKEHGVTLFVVTESADQTELIAAIESILALRPHIPPPTLR